MTVEPALILDEIDLTRARLFLDGRAHEAWRLLRAQAPVHWNAGRSAYPGFWSITRYADVVEISRDPTTFISSPGIILSTPPDEAPASGRAGAPSMIVTDPPRHARLRRLVSKGFTPRMVATLEPKVRQTITTILDTVAPLGACDFVTDVAARLPVAVICDLVGVPREDAPYMFDLTNRSLGAGDPEYQTVPGDGPATARAAIRDMNAYFSELIVARRLEPHDDLASVLTHAEIDGERLTDAELLAFCGLLIQAGNETTRNAISGGLLALIEHPDQRQRLRTEPAMLPVAIEEILRWVSPVLHMMRTATRDVEIRGQTIRTGDRVVLWYPSANRDEEVFPEPDRFDVARQPNEHLAFGQGEHFCLGAGLARLELRVMFEELLRRLPDIELAGPPERLRSTFIGGIKHMPVRFAA